MFVRGVLCLMGVLGISSAQNQFRLFPAKFKLCDDVSGLIQLNSVLISAPLATKEDCFNRHLLVKGRRVQICMNGTMPAALPFNLPISGAGGLKNSAHGTLPPLPPQDFCEIDRSGCEGANPPCDQLRPGAQVEICSVLKVPDDPILLNPLIQPDVLVRWRTLYEENFDETSCERSYEARSGQVPLICIDMEAKVVNEPKCPAPLLG